MKGHGDMALGFSPQQRQRLAEIGLDEDALVSTFDSAEERDACYEANHRELNQANVDRLDSLRTERRRPVLRTMESVLVDALVGEGFVEVATPLMMGKGALAKMGIDEEHPLWRQVYWLDSDRCLRPMLAPNLYYLLSHLQRLWPPPVSIFEVGPCFRKESKGSNHLSEFTMLNLVEFEPRGDAADRLRSLAHVAMEPTGLDYEIVETDSGVYGATLDVEVRGIEVASGVVGPHPLDEQWGVTGPWAGWGFGLERLAMMQTGGSRIHPVGRSLVYLDGARLNVQGTRPASHPVAGN